MGAGEEGGGGSEGGYLSCPKGCYLHNEELSKKGETRDKHIYVGSVAPSHAGKDWHRDLNSDLLILDPQPSSTSQPL